MASVKVGDFYTTSNSVSVASSSDITARGNRKVVELVTLEGNVFSTLPKGSSCQGLCVTLINLSVGSLASAPHTGFDFTPRLWYNRTNERKMK